MKDVSLEITVKKKERKKEITVSHRLIGPLVPNDLGSKTIKILSNFILKQRVIFSAICG